MNEVNDLTSKKTPEFYRKFALSQLNCAIPDLLEARQSPEFLPWMDNWVSRKLGLCLNFLDDDDLVKDGLDYAFQAHLVLNMFRGRERTFSTDGHIERLEDYIKKNSHI